MTLSLPLAALRSIPCIMNANVTPVRKRKIAGAIPPINCEMTYGPLSRSLGARKGMKYVALQHDRGRQSLESSRGTAVARSISFFAPEALPWV